PLLPSNRRGRPDTSSPNETPDQIQEPTRSAPTGFPASHPKPPKAARHGKTRTTRQNSPSASTDWTATPKQSAACCPARVNPPKKPPQAAKPPPPPPTPPPPPPPPPPSRRTALSTQ